MRKIIDYVMASDVVHDSVQEHVMYLIEEGYELYGSPFASQTVVHQAMVKYDPVDVYPLTISTDAFAEETKE